MFQSVQTKMVQGRFAGTFGEILFFVGFVLDVLFLFGRCGEWQVADNGETPGERTLRLSVLR